MNYFTIKPEHIKEFGCASDSLATCFVALQERWFTDRKNTLFGLSAKAHQAIVTFLETGERPGITEPNLMYVVSKFEHEWLIHFDRTER